MRRPDQPEIRVVVCRLAGLVMVVLGVAWLCAAAAFAGTASAATSDAADGPPPASSRAFFAAPLITYDSNYKLGGGAFGQLVFADPNGVQPFLASISAQVYATTGGFQAHYLRWDLPGLAGSRFRVSGRLRRGVWTRAPYFGLGNDTPRRDELEGGDWNLFEQRLWRAQLVVRRNLRGSSWDLYASGEIAQQNITRYDDSLLEEERPQGAGGGRMAWGQLGAFYDTRTNEIDPWDGIRLDFAGRTSGPWVGSDWVATGLHASWSGWRSVHHRVVLAARVMGDAVWGNPPFFTRAYLGGLSGAILGGRRLLRGLPEERLRADAVVVTQGEVRYRFATVRVFHQKTELGLMLVPFVDVAQLVMWDEPDAGFDPHVTGGGGFRINANNLLILRADVGVGIERYLRAPNRRPLVQVYVLAEHPF